MHYVITFFMVFSLVSGFLWGSAVTVLFSGCVIVFLIAGAHTLACLLPVSGFIAAFFLIPFITHGYWRMRGAALAEADDRYQYAQAAYENIVHQDEDASQRLHMWDEQIQEVVSLYEITREIANCLTLEGILEKLQALLKKTFVLTSASVVLCDTEQNDFSRKKIFSVIGERGEKDFSIWEENIVKVSFNERTPVTCLPEDTHTCKVYSIPPDVGGVMAIPLMTGTSVPAVFVGVGLQKNDFENFAVVGGQLSLGMRKVRLYEEVQKLAITDGLTGTYVRRHFDERLIEEIERAQRHKNPLTLLMIDADHFKQYNDKFGHLVGDVILKEIAGILHENVREIDLIGRYGGEEFAVLLLDTDTDEALMVADRIRQAVADKTFTAYDEHLNLTISIGIAQVHTASDAESFIEEADAALYRAKDEGRNKVCVYGKEDCGRYDG